MYLFYFLACYLDLTLPNSTGYNYFEELGWEASGFFPMAVGDLGFSTRLVLRYRDDSLLYSSWEGFFPYCNWSPIGRDEITKTQQTTLIRPNPFDEFIEISLPDESIFRLYDVNGKTRFKQNVPAGTSYLNFNELPAGVYYVRVLSKNNQIFTQKIIKF